MQTDVVKVRRAPAPSKRYQSAETLYRAVRAWARTRLVYLKKRQVQYLRALARPWELSPATPRRGRQRVESQAAFVHEITQVWGDRDPARALDDMVALSVIAGLVKPEDFGSIIAQAKRGTRKWPTLADGRDLKRKHVRKLMAQVIYPIAVPRVPKRARRRELSVIDLDGSSLSDNPGADSRPPRGKP